MEEPQYLSLRDSATNHSFAFIRALLPPQGSAVKNLPRRLAMRTLAALDLHCARCDSIGEHRLDKHLGRAGAPASPIVRARQYVLVCAACGVAQELTEQQKRSVLHYTAHPLTA